jgi:hypothetical protein
MNRILKIGKTDLFAAILLWLVFALLITLYPFNFMHKNDVTSTPEGGFHFESPSIAYLSQVPTKMSELKKFSIIMEVKSDITLIDDDGVIFGYCIDDNNHNFIMGQVRDYATFIINANGISHQISAEGIFEKDSPVWIAIIYDGNKLTFLKNGSVKNVVTTGNLDFSCWDSSYPFVFANSGDGITSWSGTIFSFDVFDSVVTISERQQLETLRSQLPPIISLSVHYEQTESHRLQGDISTPSLVIPARFKPPGKDLLVSLLHFTERGHIDHMDFFLNLLLFVPFGLLFRSLLEKYSFRYPSNFLITIVTGMFLSISIESLQSFLPERYTSAIDVLGNTSGVIAGSFVVTFPWIRKFFIL